MPERSDHVVKIMQISDLTQDAVVEAIAQLERDPGIIKIKDNKGRPVAVLTHILDWKDWPW